MQFELNEIHVWSANLAITEEQAATLLTVLSPDERERAARFHFSIHRNRYIAARDMLRRILSVYLNTPSQDLQFAYTQYGKPYLINNTQIQFNLAHSDEMAVYAVANQDVGVDIEKIRTHFNTGVAKRFFSTQEHTDLMQLPPAEQIAAFYRIWSRKEAILKAVGKGMSIPLRSFSTSVNDVNETILVEDQLWRLVSLSIDPTYQAALASNQNIKKVSYWNFFGHDPKLNNVSLL